MAKKFSVTNRYFAEKKPNAVFTSSEHIDVNGRSVLRLAFGYPEERTPTASWDFANRIYSYFPQNAIYFPDTNFLSKPIPRLIEEALLSKQIAIAPLILNEIQPWLSNPFNNQKLHDHVQAAVSADTGEWLKKITDWEPSRNDLIVFPKLDHPFFFDLGYEHYFNLLKIRRLIGLEIANELRSSMGTEPSQELIRSIAMRRYGARGDRIAREAVEKYLTTDLSPNFFADEQMLLMAALTTLRTGRETVILTWDTAAEEQFLKLWQMIKSDYLSHCSAEWACQDSNIEKFNEIKSEPSDNNPWEGDTVKSLSVFQENFEGAVLPIRFQPVMSTCIVFGGESSSLVQSPQMFCAECQMAGFLQQKSKSGRNTTRFGDWECTVSLNPAPEDGKPVVSMLLYKPRMVDCCGARISTVDKMYALMTKEPITRVDRP